MIGIDVNNLIVFLLETWCKHP